MSSDGSFIEQELHSTGMRGQYVGLFMRMTFSIQAKPYNLSVLPRRIKEDIYPSDFVKSGALCQGLVRSQLISWR